MLNRLFIVIALIVTLLSGSMEVAWAENNLPFRLKSKAALLGDVDSGTIMLSKEAGVRRPPASLTKLMTLYLAYEALATEQMTLDTELPVSEKAWRMGGSKTFVRVGDHVRVEDLLRGIAVQSGNDACVVIAEHLGGSEQGFADMMNHKARELGMFQSHFVNASGLPHTDHYSSAMDMFVLGRSIVAHFPQYAHFAQEKQYTFNGIRQYNRNRLLWRDPSITGLKTGHTQKAGYCLVATNELEGQRLAAVVMGAPSSKMREEEALRLLRYGNRMYETVRLYEAGAPVRTLRIWKGTQETIDAILEEPLLVTVLRKERDKLDVGLQYTEPLVAPIRQGEPLGKLLVKLGSKDLITREVVAKQDVPEGGLISTTLDTIRLYLGW